MTYDGFVNLCQTLAVVLRFGLLLTGCWYVQKDVSRYLDQRDKVTEIDLAYKQALVILDQQRVHCEGP